MEGGVGKKMLLAMLSIVLSFALGIVSTGIGAQWGVRTPGDIALRYLFSTESRQVCCNLTPILGHSAGQHPFLARVQWSVYCLIRLASLPVARSEIFPNHWAPGQLHSNFYFFDSAV